MYTCIFFLGQEEGLNITANSLHPGVVATNLFRHMNIFNGKLLFKSIDLISHNLDVELTVHYHLSFSSGGLDFSESIRFIVSAERDSGCLH